METEIKKLAGLVQLALEDGVLYKVSADEIIRALDTLERTLYRELNNSLYPEAVKKQLDMLSLTLSNIIFNIGNGSPGISVSACRIVVNRVNALYKKVNTYLECYRPAVARNAGRFDLLPLNSFFKTAARVATVLEERFAQDELLNLLQPYLDALRYKHNLPYHRWLWWMQFFSVMLNPVSDENLSLDALLTALNFNAPEYLNWLLARLEKEISAKYTRPDKLNYLSDLLIQYKLKEVWKECAFNPGTTSVSKWLIIMIKTAIKKTGLEQEQSLTQTQAAISEKLGTALSVPQLALFIRLLVDTNVIDQRSQSLLLKNIASVIHTARVADISPESLRINYYTPGTAAKNIVKEYLINMLNRLKMY